MGKPLHCKAHDCATGAEIIDAKASLLNLAKFVRVGIGVNAIDGSFLLHNPRSNLHSISPKVTIISQVTLVSSYFNVVISVSLQVGDLIVIVVTRPTYYTVFEVCAGELTKA